MSRLISFYMTARSRKPSRASWARKTRRAKRTRPSREIDAAESAGQPGSVEAAQPGGSAIQRDATSVYGAHTVNSEIFARVLFL